MTVLTSNSFDGGTSGATVTTGNSGGWSNWPFDNVSVGTGATLQYSSAQAAHGNLGLQVDTGSTAAQAYVGWSTTLGTNTTVRFRMNLYFTGNPSVVTDILEIDTSSQMACQPKVTTAGK